MNAQDKRAEMIRVMREGIAATEKRGEDIGGSLWTSTLRYA